MLWGLRGDHSHSAELDCGLGWGENVFDGDPLFVLEVEASHLISIIQDVCLCVL